MKGDKKIFIIKSGNRASLYGIGTYIRELTKILLATDIEFEVINLFSQEQDIIENHNNNYREISIPDEKNATEQSLRYLENVCYILKEKLSWRSDQTPIFHLNLMFHPGFCLLLKDLFKAKVVLTIHYTNWSFELLGNQSLLYSILNKQNEYRTDFDRSIIKSVTNDELLINNCDAYIYISKHSIQAYRKIRKRTGTLIHHAIEDTFIERQPNDRANIRNKYYFPEKEKIVLFVGRLDFVKGIFYLVKSFKKVLEHNKNIRLVIVGNGNYTPLFSLAQPIWSKITFTGFLSQSQLSDLYAIADVGVIPSLHEEFGYVALEMMMNKLPIIVTDAGGLNEIICDDLTGRKIPLVKTKDQIKIDVDMLENQILTLLNDSTLADRLRCHARKMFLKKYNTKLYADKMLNFYKSLI